MKYCTKCLFPDTKPDLSFDVNGVCDACRYAEEKKHIDWAQRRKELDNVLEKYKSKDSSRYDCIIPISGGKDSHYQTYVITQEYGLNPLLVNFHPREFTDLGRKNLENLKKRFGCDCIEFTPNTDIYTKMEKVGLTELGDHSWPEHLGIFTSPIQVAVAYKIPLLIWGENPQFEYGGPGSVARGPVLDKEWREKHGWFFLDKFRPEDMTKFGVEKKHLLPYLYPSDEEIKSVGVTGIFLGYYLKWDSRQHAEEMQKYGFTVHDGPTEGTYTNFENLDNKGQGLHDYFKWIKYGYGRATDHASMDIRAGRMKREEGLRLVRQHEGKIPEKYLEEYLNDFELTRMEFFKIVDKFANKSLFKKDNNGNLIRDEAGNLEKLQYDNI